MIKNTNPADNTLHVPNPNYLSPGDCEKGYKSVSLNNLSSDSIQSEDKKVIRFPSSEGDSKNRLKKEKAVIESLEENTVFVKNRKTKRSNTNFVKDFGIKSHAPKAEENLRDVREEVIDDIDQNKFNFYMGSNGDSTPHLYVDYQARLKGILLKIDDNEDLLPIEPN